MALPADEFLMNESDRSTIVEFLHTAPVLGSHARTMFIRTESRLNSLVERESRALVQAAGLQPEPDCNYVSNEAAWALLAPERQVIAFTMSFHGGVNMSGLVQYCADRENEVQGMATAIRQIATGPLAARLLKYLEDHHTVMSEYRRTGDVSAATMARVDLSVADELERPILETDWTRLRMLHVMRHPRLFFRAG